MFRNMIKLIVLDIIQSAPSDKQIIKSYLIPSFSTALQYQFIRTTRYQNGGIFGTFDLSMI